MCLELSMMSSHPALPREGHLEQVLHIFAYLKIYHNDRIPSTTPGAEPPRDARDSGSARSHSTQLETSSPD